MYVFNCRSGIWSAIRPHYPTCLNYTVFQKAMSLKRLHNSALPCISNYDFIQNTSKFACKLCIIEPLLCLSDACNLLTERNLTCHKLLTRRHYSIGPDALQGRNHGSIVGDLGAFWRQRLESELPKASRDGEWGGDIPFPSRYVHSLPTCITKI